MNPTIQFLGVGGAFSLLSKGHSNMLISTKNESEQKYMLIDCGGSIQFTLESEFGIKPHQIDAVWISHLHADHIGSIEWLAFWRYFRPNRDRQGNIVKIKLFMVADLMRELWENSLKGGLGCVNGYNMILSDYFECISTDENGQFTWENIWFNSVRTHHVQDHCRFKPSYGLFIVRKSTGKRTLVTTDTMFSPYLLKNFYDNADQIFHDCETLPVKSNVHAHYDDLKTLSIKTKHKMWLYHYADKIPTVKEDGFAGFCDKGQIFDL